MHFNIIGAGRVGKAIAQTLSTLENIKLKAVYNRNFKRAQDAIEQIGSGIPVSTLAELPPVELTFITTPDDVISLLANELTLKKSLAPQSIVVHCSGVFPAAVLNPLKELGCQIASFHPLKAFSTDLNEKFIFRGCDCVIEGDDKAVALISSLFNRLEAHIISIQAEAKPLYHAAAVMAANYLVTLAATAAELFNKAGIPENSAKQITTNLMTSSLQNICQSANIADALSGPLQRGDMSTLNIHLDILYKNQAQQLYRSAALATIPLTTLNEDKKNQLSALFSTVS